MTGCVTQDRFLDGQLTVRQPKSGYRAATDPVLLAASVRADAGARILDVGCGVGVASLCLMARVSGLTVTGLEVQGDYAALARENARGNQHDLCVEQADIAALPPHLVGEMFDVVMTNPPYFDPNSVGRPKDEGKAVANVAQMDLSAWVRACVKRVKPKGVFHIIQRAEKMPEIMAALYGAMGEITLLPITARAGQPAKRVLIRARKNSHAAPVVLAPLVMHRDAAHKVDGENFSVEAQKLLRDGNGLDVFW